jgi:hypothetical protein
VQIEDNIVYRVADDGRIVKTVGGDTFANFTSVPVKDNRKPTPLIFLAFLVIMIVLICIILFWILQAKATSPI